MTINLKSYVAALLTTVTFQTAEAATLNYSQITSVEEFLQHIVGKRLHRNRSSFYINADRTITGVYNGRPMSGVWEWDEDKNAFCLDLSIPNRRYNCKIVELENDGSQAMRFRRFRR